MLGTYCVYSTILLAAHLKYPPWLFAHNNTYSVITCVITLIITLQELGTYCGYSTILLAAHLKDPSAKVYTIDICEENVEIAKQMIAHAGLTERVVHVVKPLDEAVQVRSSSSSSSSSSGGRSSSI